MFLCAVFMLNRISVVIIFNSEFNSVTLCISQLRTFCAFTMVKPCNTLAELKEQILAAGDKLVVIDFFAEWCPPCKMMSPEIEKLATQDKDVVFLKVDVVVNTEAAERFYINALPTFILIKDGAMIDEVLGAKLDQLKEAINQHK